MFEGFARVWTPALLTRRLKQRPVRVVVAGEAVVLFRGQGGPIGALIDSCPHRAAALSLGRVTPEGCLECPFHGWRFAPDGTNQGAPLNPDARLEMLGATALPVRQAGDFIWIYTAAGEAPPGEPLAPEGLTAPGLARTYVERDWACHWTRAMENMLDSPHLPFVHRKTIGRIVRERMTPASRMDIAWEDTPYGGRATATLDGHGPGAVLDFYRPNIMALTIPVPGRHLRIHAIVTPAEAGRTRLTVAGSRDFATFGLLNPVFAWMNGRIADEDRAVVESSGPGEIPPPGVEPAVGTDRATLMFRAYYHHALRDSAA